MVEIFASRPLIRASANPALAGRVASAPPTGRCGPALAMARAVSRAASTRLRCGPVPSGCCFLAGHRGARDGHGADLDEADGLAVDPFRKRARSMRASSSDRARAAPDRGDRRAESHAQFFGAQKDAAKAAPGAIKPSPITVARAEASVKSSARRPVVVLALGLCAGAHRAAGHHRRPPRRPRRPGDRVRCWRRTTRFDLAKQAQATSSEQFDARGRATVGPSEAWPAAPCSRTAWSP